MKRNAASTLVGLLIAGLALFVVATILLAAGWPHTVIVSDVDNGPTPEVHGSRAALIFGLVSASASAMLLLVSLLGFGIRFGTVAATEDQAKADDLEVPSER